MTDAHLRGGRAECGYTLIDFSLRPVLSGDRDRAVRFMEHVRANSQRIVPGVPAACELDLFVSGHAHNVGPMPLLGLFAPASVIDHVPDPDLMTNTVSTWCEALPEAEIQSIATITEAPGWEELQRLRVHPAR